MSMYLPNPDLRPTGSEPGEFIDAGQFEPGDRPMDSDGHQSGSSVLPRMPDAESAGATTARRPLSDDA